MIAVREIVLSTQNALNVFMLFQNLAMDFSECKQWQAVNVRSFSKHICLPLSTKGAYLPKKCNQ